MRHGLSDSLWVYAVEDTSLPQSQHDIRGLHTKRRHTSPCKPHCGFHCIRSNVYLEERRHCGLLHGQNGDATVT